MAAPTIVSHSSATETTPGRFFTIPAPAGLAGNHSLIMFIAGIERADDAEQLGSGWLPSSGSPTQLTAANVTGVTGEPGTMNLDVFLLDTVGTPAADYTFEYQSAGDVILGIPANTMNFERALGHLVAIDRGVGDPPVTTGTGAVAFEGAPPTYTGIDTSHPPSLMLHFFASRDASVAASGGFGTVVASLADTWTNTLGGTSNLATLIGAADTTGDAPGSNLGSMTFTAMGRSFLGQSELLPRTSATEGGGAARESWGVLAR